MNGSDTDSPPWIAVRALMALVDKLEAENELLDKDLKQSIQWRREGEEERDELRARVDSLEAELREEGRMHVENIVALQERNTGKWIQRRLVLALLDIAGRIAGNESGLVVDLTQAWRAWGKRQAAVPPEQTP